jgi:hypothetical protein
LALFLDPDRFQGECDILRDLRVVSSAGRGGYVGEQCLVGTAIYPVTLRAKSCNSVKFYVLSRSMLVKACGPNRYTML